MVSVDSGAWFAWFVGADPRHGAVSHWIAANTAPLLTTDYCVDETLTLLVARRRPKLAVEAGQAFFQEDFGRLLFLTPDQIRRAYLVFASRAARGWSFTDCTSKVVIDDLKIRTAVSLDEHFRQFGNVTIVP
jgi:predicted nucleic acid-binding protein